MWKIGCGVVFLIGMLGYIVSLIIPNASDNLIAVITIIIIVLIVVLFIIYSNHSYNKQAEKFKNNKQWEMLSEQEKGIVVSLSYNIDKLNGTKIIDEYYKRIRKEGSLTKNDKETLKIIINILGCNQEEFETEVKEYEEEKRKIEKEEKEKKQKLEKEEKNIKDEYIKDFILSTVLKRENHEITEEEYQKELTLLIRYIKLKANKEYSRNEINSLISSMKSPIFLEQLKDSIFYKNTLSYQENLQSAYSELGEDVLSFHYQYYLSKLLGKDFKELGDDLEAICAWGRNTSKTKKIEDKLSGKNIDDFNGVDFEDYLENLFVKMGYKVKTTPTSGDQGADLLLSDGMTRIAVQAKRYSGTVGNKSVQEVHTAKNHYNCDIAVVITNSNFTKSAYELAKSNNVKLIDRKRLINIVENGKITFLDYINSTN